MPVKIKQCAGKTKQNTRCKRTSTSKYCPMHQKGGSCAYHQKKTKQSGGNCGAIHEDELMGGKRKMTKQRGGHYPIENHEVDFFVEFPEETQELESIEPLEPLELPEYQEEQMGGKRKNKTKQRGGTITSVSEYALSSKKNYKKVHDYLSKKFNAENIEFLKMVNEYKKFPTPSKLIDIYFQFIDKDSDKQVNLPSQIVQDIEDVVMATPINTIDALPTFYDKAKEDIEKLLNANYLQDFQ